MMSLLARGEPMVWLTGGALALAITMIVSLLAYILFQGAATFWPMPIEQFTLKDASVLAGHVTRSETYPDEHDPQIRHKRFLVRTGNYDLTNEHFAWVDANDVVEKTQPEWMMLIERLEWGRFYGTPVRFTIDGEVRATEPSEIWKLYHEYHEETRDRYEQRQHIERHDLGALSKREESARVAIRQAELKAGPGSAKVQAAETEHERVEAEALAESQIFLAKIRELNEENERYKMVLATAQGEEKSIALHEIVRAVPVAQLSTGGKWAVYLSRWREFLLAEPREANSEGGVFPAIFGTVFMVLIMTVLVVPFGVLAALYLREYAKGGFVVSAVRIAINNLAGVPSIVFGVFGLGFFCYIIGAGIDEIFFSARLPNPTYGKGALIWASFTLALLTLPVVIVATEEALSAVPNSMREGSYACGASKWQTIKRIVLPRALPGMMTGMILAMARGAGEVAPLMVVGAVKLAPELPFSFNPSEQFGVNRSFMHLGFHIYDLGFQSQNSEAAQPMVFTTTLLLIVIVALLNLTAIWLRTRLRRKFESSAF